MSLRDIPFIWIIFVLAIPGYGQVQPLSAGDHKLLLVMLASRLTGQYQFGWHSLPNGGQLTVRTFDHAIVISTNSPPLSQTISVSQKTCLGVTPEINAEFFNIPPTPPQSIRKQTFWKVIEEILDAMAEKLGKAEQRTVKGLQLFSSGLELLKLYNDDQLTKSAQRIDAYLSSEAGLKELSPLLTDIERRIRDVDPDVIGALHQDDLETAGYEKISGQKAPNLDLHANLLRLRHYGRPDCFR